MTFRTEDDLDVWVRYSRWRKSWMYMVTIPGTWGEPDTTVRKGKGYPDRHRAHEAGERARVDYITALRTTERTSWARSSIRERDGEGPHAAPRTTD